MLELLGAVFVFGVGYVLGVSSGTYVTRRKHLAQFLSAGNMLLRKQEQIKQMDPNAAAFYALSVAEQSLECSDEHPTPVTETNQLKE